MKKIVSIVCLAVVLISCGSKGGEEAEYFTTVDGKEIPLIRLDLAEDSAQTIGLSSIFEDAQIIPLETHKKCMIKNWETGLSPNSLYLATQTGSLGPVRLMEFDLEGNYLRDFGRGGNGPGEHTGYMLMHVRYYPEYETVLAEFNGYPEENHLFTPDGSFLKTVKFPFELAGGLTMLDQNLYVTPGVAYGHPNYARDSVMLSWHNEDGTVIQELERRKYPPVNNKGFTPIGGWKSLYRYGDEWHFHNPGNDTIYAISGLNYETIAVVKMGEGGVQLNEVIDPSEVIGQYNIEILAENQRYWMIKKTLITVADVKDYGAGQWGGMWDWDHSFVIVDKETGIAQNYKFEDDLFGIIPWGEMNYHFWWDDSGRFYMVIGAMNLVESIDQALEDGTIPDKNLDRVKELRQSITEESNPVLFLFEEREKYKI